MPKAIEFTQEIADTICDRIADGRTLRATLRESNDLPGMTTIFKWLDQNEAFAKQYARACDERVESMNEDLMDISDEAVGLDAAGVQAKKLQIETRKWLMGKAKPKKYGDRLQVDNIHSFEQQSTDDLQTRAIKLAQSIGLPQLNELTSSDELKKIAE